MSLEWGTGFQESGPEHGRLQQLRRRTISDKSFLVFVFMC